MWDYLDYGKALLLSSGLDVVVDSTAPNKRTRAPLLNTNYNGVIFAAEKYLMTLRVDKEELAKRDHPESVLIWDRYWEEPKPNPAGHAVLEYRNNTTGDRQIIFADLERRFARKTKLWVPASR